MKGFINKFCFCLLISFDVLWAENLPPGPLNTPLLEAPAPHLNPGRLQLDYPRGLSEENFDVADITPRIRLFAKFVELGATLSNMSIISIPAILWPLFLKNQLGMTFNSYDEEVLRNLPIALISIYGLAVGYVTSANVEAEFIAGIENFPRQTGWSTCKNMMSGMIKAFGLRRARSQ